MLGLLLVGMLARMLALLLVVLSQWVLDRLPVPLLMGQEGMLQALLLYGATPAYLYPGLLKLISQLSLSLLLALLLLDPHIDRGLDHLLDQNKQLPMP